MEYKTESLAETYQLAEKVATGLQPKNDQAVVLCLFGELGSGKTAFVQGLARALGVSETVNSPTFVVMKTYRLLPNKLFTRLIHIDAYRLDQKGEESILDFPDLAKDPKNLIVVEWPEKLTEIPPIETLDFYFTFVDESARLIKYDHQEL